MKKTLDHFQTKIELAYSGVRDARKKLDGLGLPDKDDIPIRRNLNAAAHDLLGIMEDQNNVLIAEDDRVYADLLKSGELFTLGRLI